MPLNAQEVTARPLALLANEMPAVAANLQEVRALPVPEVTAGVLGLSANMMPAVAAAGVDLAKAVLKIVAGVILILIGYLVWMDYSVAANVADAYKQVHSPSRIGSEFFTLDRLEQFAADLNAARTNPNQTIPQESDQRDREVIDMLGNLPSMTSAQKTQLNQCLPLPTDASRSDKLGQCVAIVENVRQAAVGTAASTMTAQMASESVGKIQDQRQSLHTFWIQVAQLILLNLLLPLLTALFGYIFGTQQAAAKA